MWLKILSVFALGMVGLWEGIPAGYALRLNPALIGLLSAVGSTTATLLVLVLGDRVRARLLRSRTAAEGPPGELMPPRERLIDRVWRRYGIIGLGLLAPGLTGAPIGVALGLFLGAPVGRLLFWALIGVALWTVALTVAGMYGTAGILRLLQR